MAVSPRFSITANYLKQTALAWQTYSSFEWHPVRVPWTRLRILGLHKMVDGHWQPMLYLSTDYSEYPAPRYDALRAKVHDELRRICTAEQEQELAATLESMHLEAAGNPLGIEGESNWKNCSDAKMAYFTSESGYDILTCKD